MNKKLIINQSRAGQWPTLLLALLLYLPLSMRGQTKYDLWIGDTQVTSANVSSFQGLSVSAEGSTVTVTLNNATLTDGLRTMSNLVIDLIGENSITAADSSAIQSWAYGLTRTLTFKSSGETPGSLVLTPSDSYKAYDASHDDSEFQATFEDNLVVTPSNFYSGETVYIERGYDIWIADSRLSKHNTNGGHSGDVGYDDETHTFTIGGFNYNVTITSKMPALTVNVSNSNYVNDIVFEATDEVPNGTLTLVATKENATLDLFPAQLEEPATGYAEPFGGFSNVSYQGGFALEYIETSEYYSRPYYSLHTLPVPDYHFTTSGQSYYSNGSTVYNLYFGQENTLPWLMDVPEVLAITYSSSDENVATIDEEGMITLKGAGYVWISASNEQTEDFAAHEERIRLEIKPSDPQASIEQGAYYTGQTLEMIATVPNGEMYYQIGWEGEKVKYTEPIALEKGKWEISLYTLCSSDEGEIWSYGNNHPTYYVYDPLTFTPESGTTDNDAFEVEIGNLPEVSEMNPTTIYYYFDENDDDPTAYSETTKPTVAESSKLNAFIEVEGDSGYVYRTEPVEAEYTVIPKTQLNISYAQNSREWASYYADEQSLETPEGLQAFVVTEVKDDGVSVAEIPFIPQGEGILLKRVEDVEEPIMARAWMEEDQPEAQPEAAENLLQGTAENKAVSTVSGNVYVLYNDGFTRAYRGSIPAHRAYLVTEDDASARLWIWEDEEETTAVGRVRFDSVATDGPLYNLNGQRVSNPTKGLYINHGKKRIVK